MDISQKITKLENYLRSRNFKIVINECKKLIKENPSNGYLCNLCGLAYQGDNKFNFSIEYFEKAMNLDENNLDAMNNLANSYKSIGKLDLAESFYLKVLKINKNHPQALFNFGNLKNYLNDIPGSIELHQRFLEIKKDDPLVLLSLAVSYRASGNFKNALEICNKILKKNPKFIIAHKFLSTLVDYKKDKIHLNQMKNLIEDKNLTKENLINLLFALGKGYEDIEDYEKSFEYIKKANNLKKQTLKYKVAKDEKLFQNLIKSFEEVNFGNKTNKVKEKKIIFICGMPRSGTTLVEQIIGSHRNVMAGGELIYLNEIINKLFINDNEIIKQKLEEEIESKNNKLNIEYFNKLKFYKFKSLVITDKAPLNFKWIGFIKLFFPNAKVLYCHRNAKDNCFSIYKNIFASNSMDWSYDEETIYKYYNLNLDLVKFWERKFPNFIYYANYDKIIQTPEVEIKKIIKYCDLTWDPSCLKYYNNKKNPIKTLSVVQARKSIYSSSVNLSDKYSPYLSNLFSSLKNFN